MILVRQLTRRAATAVWAAFLLLGLGRIEAAEPLFFIQLSDPQFGFWAKNVDSCQETANFEFAIATANRLRPAFVIVTGDLVNKADQTPEADEYLRIAAKLDRSIPLYQLPGNHDVGNEPTAKSIARYTARFGPDYYAFRCGPVLGLVLNSCLIQFPNGAPQQAAAQEAWLKAEFEKARREKIPHVLVFQHHPWFVETVDEADGYHNLPLAVRRQFLDLFQDAGVTHVFAGHYHANRTARCGTVEIVTSGAIGKPLRKDVSGLRVVIVRETGIEHRFYHLGEIPNRIDLGIPKPAAKKGD